MIKYIDFNNNKSAYIVATNNSPTIQSFSINDEIHKIKQFDKLILNVNDDGINKFINFNNIDIKIKNVLDREYYELEENNEVPLQFGMFTLDEIRRARKKNQLLSLWINLSNICNLECRYCFNSAGKKLEGELSKEQIINLCKQAKELGCKKIVIVGSGEPLADPNFKEIINYIDKLNMETVLFTNGILLTNELCEFLLDKNVKICLKFHSFNFDVSDFLIGKYKSKKIFYSLEKLMKYNFHTLGKLSLANQIFKQNLNDIIDVYHFCRKNNIIPRVSKILFKGKGQTCKELYPSEKEVKNLFAELKEIDKKTYNLNWGNFNNNVYAGDQGCQLSYINLFVDVFGNVQPCIGILKTLGNIKDKLLKNMWENNYMKNIDLLLEGKCTECVNNKIYRCYGCAGRNYLENKSEFSSRICGNFRKE